MRRTAASKACINVCQQLFAAGRRETLDRIEGEGLVAFRYAGVNPNGSLRDIAGLTNPGGNVVGLMPHPEHATEPGFGPDTSAAMRSGVDGLPFFTSAIAAVARVAA